MTRAFRYLPGVLSAVLVASALSASAPRAASASVGACAAMPKDARLNRDSATSASDAWAVGGFNSMPGRLAILSRMLSARFQVVKFIGRESELAALASWRDSSEARLAAMWIRAPGGQGKTRLAARFAELSAAAGWKVVTASHLSGSVIPSPGSQGLRLVGAAGLLMIIDYADRWPLSHLTWLFSNALLHKQLPTRILLVGRAGSAWSAIRSALTEQGAKSGDLLVPPLAGADLSQRREMFDAARRCFAEQYGVQDSVGISSPVPLDQSDFGLTLAIHMAALTAVDARARGARAPGDLVGLTA
jgi:hypothetical protein